MSFIPSPYSKIEVDHLEAQIDAAIEEAEDREE